MWINLKSLNNYLALYTNVIIKQEWKQLVFWNYVMDIDSKYVAMTIYWQAISDMINWNHLTTIKVFYLQDLVTMYLKEVAKANDIDPSQYRWSADLIKEFPEYWLFYNTIEWFKQHITWIASWVKKWKADFPLAFLESVITWNFQKYVQSSATPKEKEEAKTSIWYWKSFDDIL